MGKKRITAIAAVLIISITTLSGCGDNIIFKNKNVQQTKYSVATLDTLMSDLFYVKDGTKFYPMHTFGGESAQYAPDPSNDNILLFAKQEKNIPVLYQNETVCVKSGDDSVYQTLLVERYKPVGWTLGIRAMTYNDSGDYFTASKNNLKDKSSMSAVTDKYINGDNFNIRTIDGKRFSLTKAGTVNNLTKGEDYTLGVFVGSEYADMKAYADSHLYESSETFNFDPLELTTIGYVEYQMPEDAKSGLYLLGDAGYFLYIADRKASAKDLESYDLTEPNLFDGITHSIDDTLKKTENTKKFRIKSNVNQTSVRLSYSEDFIQVDSAYILTPNGRKIEIDMNTGSADINNPEEGEYKVVMYGYNTMDVDVTHSDDNEEVEEEDTKPTPTPTPTPTPSASPSVTPKAEPSKETPIEAQTVTPVPTQQTSQKDVSGGGTVQQIQPQVQPQVQTQQPVQEPQYTYTQPNTTEQNNDKYYYTPEEDPLEEGEIGDTTPG